MAEYDIDAVRGHLSRDQLSGRVKSLWRYREMLPVRDDRFIVSLGEGFTPIIPLKRLAESLGLSSLAVKDDGLMPTGTFKSRGISAAVSRAIELGIREIVMPSAGSAATALAAYSGHAGIRATIYLPDDVPEQIKMECELYGGDVNLVEGTISDAGEAAARYGREKGVFSMGTLREPYRLEGDKTMGYEIAEQLGWRLPDLIIYPTGGGIGLIGMWKAFDEMERLGWINSFRPRMISVQVDGCDPIVRAFETGAKEAQPHPNPSTRIPGLRVPCPRCSDITLNVIYKSGGLAVRVGETEISSSIVELARQGVYACPEGAATLAALRKLLRSGQVAPSDRVLLYNTGSGLKYGGHRTVLSSR